MCEDIAFNAATSIIIGTESCVGNEACRVIGKEVATLISIGSKSCRDGATACLAIGREHAATLIYLRPYVGLVHRDSLVSPSHEAS
jgi:hypothetical protein